MAYDYLIVGAGLAGSVCARQLADAGEKVLIIDRRPHIGGNCHDAYDKNGVLVHSYGPHAFHTDNKKVFEFLSRFTDWRFYEHRVRAVVGDKTYPFPVNGDTIDMLYGQDLSHTFYEGYTRKQWQLDIAELSPEVINRVNGRLSRDDRYFTDQYQFMPTEGYTCMFRRMLDHPNITVELNVDYFDIREEVETERIIYTGPIDKFFDYHFGKLPYRSLRFEHEHDVTTEYRQQCATYNYPSIDVPYTRIVEWKHMMGQVCKGTSYTKEFPVDDAENPYYPIPRPENQEFYHKYADEAEKLMNVHFVGRLGEYRYLNMDQTVESALKLFEKIKGGS